MQTMPTHRMFRVLQFALPSLNLVDFTQRTFHTNGIRLLKNSNFYSFIYAKTDLQACPLFLNPKTYCLSSVNTLTREITDSEISPLPELLKGATLTLLHSEQQKLPGHSDECSRAKGKNLLSQKANSLLL